MTLIIGHRGGRDLWPENSLSGFVETAALGIDGVELDVHLSADDELVVIHDATLDRTTEGIGEVAALTAAARLATPLRGTDGEVVPLLAEALAVFRETVMEVHVELKADAAGERYEGLARRALDLIGDLGMRDQCVLTSFSRETLEDVRAVDPRCRTLASLARPSADRLGGFGAAVEHFRPIVDLLAIEQSLLDEVLEEAVARWPLERLCVWVPNTEAQLATWMVRGVGYVTTDRPDLALAARAAIAAG